MADVHAWRRALARGPARPAVRRQSEEPGFTERQPSGDCEFLVGGRCERAHLSRAESESHSTGRVPQ